MKYADKVFLIVIFAVCVIAVYIHFGFPSIKEAFYAELFAGFLGILIAFYLDRVLEEYQKSKITKQILKKILFELQNNLKLVKQFKSEIKMPKYHRFGSGSPYGTDIQFFSFFQTNTWDTFSSKLESEKIDLLYSLGMLYQNLRLFNEAVRIESTGERRLQFLLRKDPDFLSRVEIEIKKIISDLKTIKLKP